jgi:hypothetical protein
MYPTIYDFDLDVGCEVCEELNFIIGLNTEIFRFCPVTLALR